MSDLIYPNGIDLDTGTYAVPPIRPEDLDALLGRQKERPENIGDLESRAHAPDSLGVMEGVDPRRLEEAGWGVIFAEDADPAVEQALAPLLKLRQAQAGARFKNYCGKQGFRAAGDTKGSFLARNGVGPGPVDTRQVPYYLLIVGDPQTIPFSFQNQLDVQYAVGRIHFDTPADYASYATSVVAAETGQVKLPRQASFFGVGHERPDTATQQSLDYLISPLSQALGATPGWELDVVRGPEARKVALSRRLGGGQTPALLFTASHGLAVAPNNRYGLAPAEYQGALICADWPGPQTPFEDRSMFFAGRDLAPDAQLLGLIGFFFACFGGGTPRDDGYSRLLRIQEGQRPGPARQIVSQPFIADLPRRMLSAPGGGALAVIGHVERTWPGSYLWKAAPDGSLPPQTAAFESTLRQLMSGYPVGAALEFLNQRYAELATMLLPFFDSITFNDSYDRTEFINVWMAANDAQWYTIIGDPAVRLPVGDEPSVAPRPFLVTPILSPHTSGAQTSETQQGQGGPSGPRAGTTSVEGGAHGEQAAGPDPRSAQPFTPPPGADGDLAKLKADHPELYRSYIAHVQEGYKNNTRIFDEVQAALMRSHNSTLVMYWILFAIGVGTVLTGMALALRGSEMTGAIFLGVGAAAFITYFIGRSTLSVEENLIYIAWLGVIYNSYWTHLAWATQRDTAQKELDEATVKAVAQLERLVDRHARSAGSRPGLIAPPKPESAPQAGQPTPGDPGA